MKSLIYLKDSKSEFAQILSSISPKNRKQSIYFDIDDCVLDTLPAVVQIINSKYRPSLPPKSPSSVRDWNFKSIHRSLTSSQLNSIFESDEFWSTVRINPQFISLLSSPSLKSYNCYFVTKGSEANLNRKLAFLETHLGPYIKNFLYIGLPTTLSKGFIDMTNSIIIDDNISFLLETNAKIKVLNTNLRQTEYNNAFGAYNNQLDESIYFANDMSEVKDLLEFNLKQPL